MAQTDLVNENADFDQIIETIGHKGPFQTRFNIIFNCIVSVLLSMPYMNLIISLAVPDHWCHVSGRAETNYSLDEWKQLTIPNEIDIYGNLRYSKCTRFGNVSGSSDFDKIIKCDQGWDYDHTWYDLTAPMQNDWVCDNSMVPSNTLAVGRLGEVIGTFVIAHISDNFGRMPVFYITLVAIILGRLMSVFTSSWIYLFLTASFIGSFCSTVVFIGPYIILMEISRAEDRAFIGLIGFISCTLGMTILPIAMWLLRDWSYFMLVTTLPCGIYIFSRPWIIESPRWLASKGKIRRCVKELEKISKMNKTIVPSNLVEQLTNICEKQDSTKTHTMMSFLSSWRLAKNTLLMIYCAISTAVVNMSLDINVGTMDGNPFTQYIFQSLVQLPSYFLGKWICNQFGRRWSMLLGFVLGTIGSATAIFFLNDPTNLWIVNLICIFIKFSVSLCVYTSVVISMEIFPTCIRQMGTSLGPFIGNLFSVLSPYIITLGISINPLIPFVIFATILFIAQICCLFLPETRGKKLPETLKDAEVFGADQDIWGKTKLQNIVLDQTL